MTRQSSDLLQINPNGSKEYGAAGPPLGDRAGSYGVGMIGVGTSIGAYGR